MVRKVNVRAHTRTIGAKKTKSSDSKSFRVQCAYCKGKGTVPDSLLGPKECPVKKCRGGWVTLPGSKSDYRKCGTCNGAGKEPGSLMGPKLCRSCKGVGLV